MAKTQDTGCAVFKIIISTSVISATQICVMKCALPKDIRAQKFYFRILLVECSPSEVAVLFDVLLRRGRNHTSMKCVDAVKSTDLNHTWSFFFHFMIFSFKNTLKCIHELALCSLYAPNWKYYRDRYYSDPLPFASGHKIQHF